MLGFVLFFQQHLPSFAEVFYGHLLNWAGELFVLCSIESTTMVAGPIFLLVQAVQMVRLIMEIGKLFAAQRESNIVLVEVRVPNSMNDLVTADTDPTRR